MMENPMSSDVENYTLNKLADALRVMLCGDYKFTKKDNCVVVSKTYELNNKIDRPLNSDDFYFDKAHPEGNRLLRAMGKYLEKLKAEEHPSLKKIKFYIGPENSEDKPEIAQAMGESMFETFLPAKNIDFVNATENSRNHRAWIISSWDKGNNGKYELKYKYFSLSPDVLLKEDIEGKRIKMPTPSLSEGEKVVGFLSAGTADALTLKTYKTIENLKKKFGPQEISN